MERFFTKTFFRFLTAFLTILTIAFGALTIIARQMNAGPQAVDTVAGAR